MKRVVTAENLHKAVKHVRHDQLERLSVDSPYRSWCPVCKQGVLLVARRGVELLRHDHCSLCAQRFLYEDDEIAGQKLPPLEVPREIEIRTRFERMS